MPTLNNRPCNWKGFPRCPKLAVQGSSFCEEHKKRTWREYDQTRPSAAIRLGRNWHKLRQMVLNNNPVCVNPFQIPNHEVLANEVDHIIPVAKGGTNDLENLQPLCKPCHGRKTAEEVGFGRKKGNQ